MDLATALVVSIAVGVGVLVYRWAAPAAGTAGGMSKGERLVCAVAAMAAVVAIGGYAADGVSSDAPRGKAPFPSTAVTASRDPS
ncbi:hypothetical protein [Streptomyces mirabilis]|uniref:hypothetical protein n=1 Tax=Streptomyces mirabilis TaxID=68239 RepID=UPI0036DDA306